MAAIFGFSSIPGQDIPGFGTLDVIVKKGGHMLGYALLATSFWHGLRWKNKLWWAALLLSVAYALSDEYHQAFVPGRHSSLADVAIDAVGSSVALIICLWVRKRYSRGLRKRGS